LQTSSRLSGSRKIVLFIVVACFLLVAVIEGGFVHVAAPITAKVVDSATGQPIEGANVVATWNLEGGLEGGAITGHAMVMEAVTDANGQFRFPGWGPTLGYAAGEIKAAAPELLIFKSGYRYWTARNHGLLRPAPFYMHSDYNGAVIKLDRFTGSVEEYAKATSDPLNIDVNSLLANNECNWKQIPRFLWSIQQQNQVFLAQRTMHPLYSLAYLRDAYRRGRCGDLKAFVEGHGR
jgi:hypothetical protein